MESALELPVWLLAVPPIAALVSVTIWTIAPARRRDPALRVALIASVGLTAIEATLVGLFAGIVLLFRASGWTVTF